MKDRLPSWPCCFLSTVFLYSSSSFSVRLLKGLGGRERVCSSSSMMKACLKGEKKMTFWSPDVIHFAVNRSNCSNGTMTTGFSKSSEQFSNLYFIFTQQYMHFWLLSYRNQIQISSFDPVMRCVSLCDKNRLNSFQ